MSNLFDGNNDGNISDNVDIRKSNFRNPKYKSNLNNDNDNRVDNSKNNNNNNNKKSVFVHRGRIKKNLNSFLIAKAINHKCIIKVCHLVQQNCNACTTI